jgi:V8-like Glu-specific endopeptidase
VSRQRVRPVPVLGALAIFAGLAGGCLTGEVDEAGHLEQAIIGGRVDLADPAVVGLRMCVSGSGCSICTGTLVGRQTVLTASHCIDQNVEAGEPERVEVFFGTSMDGEGTRIAADALALHRYFDPATLDYDIAMIHLAEPAPPEIEPVVPGIQPLVSDDVGMAIRLVGFGETALGAGDAGTKRQVTTVLTSVAARHIFVGTSDANTCKGDSGGPTFADLGDGEVQIGVTSRSRGCEANSVKMRVDVFTREFIWPWIDRFEGPCALDGVCVEDCPRSPDPDCDPCLWDGTCAEGCPAPDWDCPVGKLLGQTCEGDAECEFGRCQAGLDDPRVLYCSRPCDPEIRGTCLEGMLCTDPDGGGDRCVWSAPTPGALGSSCGQNSACRSGLCEVGVCVERCDEVAGGSCPAPFECRASELTEDEVCGPPLDGGGCGCGAGGPAAPGLALILAGLALALSRRRCVRGSAGTCGGGPGPRRARPDRR